MNMLKWENYCYEISDAEDKLPSLRLRRIKQLLRWLDSIDLKYAIMEDIDILQIQDVQELLEHEAWLRELQIKGECEI
jgi:hypothetical protein